jgi:hypothetical protein
MTRVGAYVAPEVINSHSCVIRRLGWLIRSGVYSGRREMLLGTVQVGLAICVGRNQVHSRHLIGRSRVVLGGRVRSRQISGRVGTDRITSLDVRIRREHSFIRLERRIQGLNNRLDVRHLLIKYIKIQSWRSAHVRPPPHLLTRPNNEQGTQLSQ